MAAPIPLTLPLASAPHALTRGEGWRLTVMATLMMTVSYIDRQVLAAMAPSVQAALGINNTQYGWVQSAFSFAYLAAAPVAGMMLDRTGTRLGLLTAVGLWSLAAAGHSLVPSFTVLLLLRIALGATEAPSFSGAVQVVRRALPREDRPAGYGLLLTGSSLGAVIAVPLALRLESMFGWRGAFLGTALVGATWLPLWLFLTRSQAAQAALSVAPDAGPAGPPSRLKLLAHPAVLRSIVLVMASAPAMMFVLLWYPKYLHTAFAIPQAELARYLWLPPLFMDIGAIGFGVVASRRERALQGQESEQRISSHVDLVLLAAVATAALAAVPLASGPWGVAILGAATMFGAGGLYGRLTADMTARIDPGQVSTACGYTAATQSLVYIVANPLVGRLADGHGLSGYYWAVIALGLLAIPGALTWAAWPVKDSPRPSHQPGAAP